MTAGRALSSRGLTGHDARPVHLYTTNGTYTHTGIVEVAHTRRATRYTVTPNPLPADHGGPIGEVPQLPFITDTPRCMGEGDTFEIAGTEGRPHTPTERAQIVAADREAHDVCNRCPLLVGCREYALTTRQRWGVWGGTNLPERIAWLVKYGPELDRLKGLPVNDDERRRKFADVETLPLFSPEAATVNKGSVERPKRRSLKAVAQGNCPNCSNVGVRLEVVGRHWVWVEHFYRTWSGVTRPCTASGAACCVAPEDAGATFNGKPVQCPHGPDPLDENDDDTTGTVTGGCK